MTFHMDHGLSHGSSSFHTAIRLLMEGFLGWHVATDRGETHSGLGIGNIDAVCIAAYTDPAQRHVLRELVFCDLFG